MEGMLSASGPASDGFQSTKVSVFSFMHKNFFFFSLRTCPLSGSYRDTCKDPVKF